jgi:hypothetical protein
LALRRAAVLGRAPTEAFSQDFEERCPVVGDLDDGPVDTQGKRGRRVRRHGVG